MGRPGCPARKHFTQWGSRKVNSSHYPFRCKRCLAKRYLLEAARRLQNPACSEPNAPWSPPITGRQTNLDNHLRIVHGIVDPASVPAPTTPTPNGPFESSPPRIPPRPPAQPSQQSRSNYNPPAYHTPSAGNVADNDQDGVYRRNYSPAQRRQFEHFLLEFQVDLALPDSFVEHASFKRLLYFLSPDCLVILPSRRVMGGRILNEYAAEYVDQKCLELRTCQERYGGRVNLLSDVWQNIARTHLLGVHLTLFGIVLVEGLHKVGSEHHGIALARQMEELLEISLQRGWKVGAVITDNAGQCERARRILAFRHPSIHFGKCFAHDVNNLTKAILKRTGFREVADKACAAVTAMNGSSSKWLPRANKVIMETYDFVRPLAFLSLCYTRWNSMQACFASLLRVKTGLKQFATRFQFDKEVPRAVLVFLDEGFWSTLMDAERTIRPLCNASFVLQRDENTLVDVVVCYRNIFDGFVAGPHASELIPLVEARWADCEQPLFLLAMFLHPGYRKEANALPSRGIASIDSVCTFGVFYFKRFFPDRDPGMLRHHMFEWCSATLYVGEYDCLSFDEFPTVQDFWRYAKTKTPGPNLPDLALAVLSIAANTATCERYFSALGRIHTPTRNCLKADKTNKVAMMSQAIRERDRRESRSQACSGHEQDDFSEVEEEDSDGNKFTGRIISSAERCFRRDAWVSHQTVDTPTADRITSHLNMVDPCLAISSTRPPASPSYPPATSIRSPEPSTILVAAACRTPMTPCRPRSTSGTCPQIPSRPRSRHSPIVPPSHIDGSPASRRALRFADIGIDHSSSSAQEDYTSGVQEMESLTSDQTNTAIEIAPEVPSARARDILSFWCETFDQISDDTPTDLVADVIMQEEYRERNGEIVNGRLQPIPEFNDTTFPQEAKTPPGLRGMKMSLVELFSLQSTL